MEVDRNGLEVLGREECLRLLAGATLGRVGVTSGADMISGRRISAGQPRTREVL